MCRTVCRNDIRPISDRVLYRFSFLTLRGMHVGGMSRGMRFGGMSGGRHFSGGRFAGAHFAHAGFSPRFSRFAFHDGFHHGFHHDHFFHHRFHRFAFFGAPYYSYASYDSCWRRVWTSYGPQWVNICGDYGY
jgi:hypothetical protein